MKPPLRSCHDMSTMARPQPTFGANPHTTQSALHSLAMDAAPLSPPDRGHGLLVIDFLQFVDPRAFAWLRYGPLRIPLARFLCLVRPIATS